MTLDQMQAKIDAAVENLDLLKRIPQATYEEFRSDFRNVHSALHLMQTIGPCSPSGTESSTSTRGSTQRSSIGS